MHNLVPFFLFCGGIVYSWIGEKIGDWTGTFTERDENEDLFMRCLWPIMVWLPICWHIQDKRDVKKLSI